MGIYRKYFFVILLLLLPAISNAQVVINEVQLSPTGERFLELYNTGDSAVDLTGWYMQRKTATGSSFGSLVSNPNFEGKTISIHGYFVISRNSLSSSNIVLSALTLTESNTIQIKNSGGDVVDKIGWGSVSDCGNPCSSNPPDGQSIQKTMSGWIVASPTPGAVNSSTSASTSTTTDQTTTTTTNIAATATASNQNLSSSAHYSAIPISDLETELKFEVSAGRNRLGTTGSPLEFKVETNVRYTRSNIFKWNFGDGTVGYGVTLSHAYEYPGEYAVVLNATLPEGEAVARVNVKIIAPEIFVVSASPERIELKNNSKYEVSLFGRVLVSDGKVFVFPQDTIIKAGQSISFGANITNLRPNGIHDVAILVMGESVVQPNLEVKIEKQRLEKVTAIRSEIDILQQQRLALLQREVSNPEIVVEEKKDDSSIQQTALVLDSVPQIKSGRINGWLETLKKFLFRTQE
ncbi:MAG: lamin tail domain-containing protein [bacterium]|nr:lamin tail domain-containing protein [bacterium]